MEDHFEEQKFLSSLHKHDSLTHIVLFALEYVACYFQFHAQENGVEIVKKIALYVKILHFLRWIEVG